MIEDRWERYLYERHTPEQLAKWARSLRWFRFCRAYGGHANDGDHLLVAIAVHDDLNTVFDALGLPLTPISGPVPERCVTYTGTEWATLSFPIPGFEEFAQPGWVRLADYDAYVTAGPHDVRISVPDATQRYDVTEAAVAAARRIEELLTPLASQIVDPPQNDRNCLCPQQYPAIWS